MSFPKKGKSFPGNGTGSNGYSCGSTVAEAIAGALHRELGQSHMAVKTVVRWTDASERAAKNWLAGRFAPSSEHLVALVRYSDEVLFAVLLLAGREDVAAASVVPGIRDRLRWIIETLDRTIPDVGDRKGT